jgi:hypothetical protein
VKNVRVKNMDIVGIQFIGGIAGDVNPTFAIRGVWS